MHNHLNSLAGCCYFQHSRIRRSFFSLPFNRSCLLCIESSLFNNMPLQQRIFFGRRHWVYNLSNKIKKLFSSETVTFAELIKLESNLFFLMVWIANCLASFDLTFEAHTNAFFHSSNIRHHLWYIVTYIILLQLKLFFSYPDIT